MSVPTSVSVSVFREGASHLLSLTAFGGSKVKPYETFFAAQVKEREKTFDQLFIIVNSEQHDVLLGLPTITAVGMHLVTAEGENLMLDAKTALTLDLGGTGPVPQRVMVIMLLNDATTVDRNHLSNGSEIDIDPYSAFNFIEFGLPQCKRIQRHQKLDPVSENESEDSEEDCRVLSDD